MREVGDHGDACLVATDHPGEGARGHGWRLKGEGWAGSGDPGVRAPVKIWPGGGVGRWADKEGRRQDGLRMG